MLRTLLCLILCAPLPLGANSKLDSLQSAAAVEKDPRSLAGIYAGICQLSRSVNTDTAEAYGWKAVALAKKDNYLSGLAKAYTSLGYVYEATGRIDDALLFADTGRRYAVRSGDYRSEIFAEMLSGVAFRRKAVFDSSLAHELRALQIAEHHKDDDFQAKAMNNLGIFYATTQDFERAEQYHKKALAIRLRLGNDRDIYQSYENLGILNRGSGDLDKALDYYFKALEYAVKSNDSADIAFNCNDIGAAYSKKNDVVNGEKYLLLSIAVRERHNLKNELAYTYNYLGENYERKGDYAAGERYIKKALALAEEIKNNKQTYEALESLSEFYARNGKYDSAYRYSLLYKNFREDLLKKDRARIIEELTTKYETQKKEHTIQLQRFEITKRNYWIAGISALALLGSASVYSGYKRYRLRQKTVLQAAILQQQELATRSVIEAEERERKRIAGDLHDSVGQMMSAAKINLSTLKTEIGFSSPHQRERFEKVLSLVDESCREVRVVSHNIMPNALIKSSLAAAIRDFISKIDHRIIEINLFTEGLNEKIDENVEIVLYRVLQECVNNVIRHAGANKLDISLIRDEGGISATVEDNGKGFDAGNKDSFTGIGMKNIITRIDYLKGSVEWDAAPGKGTVVTIHVPVRL